MTLLREIKEAVSTYNRRLSYVAGDSAIRRIFDIEPRNENERPTILLMRLETTIFLFQAMTYKKPTPEIRTKLVKSEFAEYYWKLFEHNARKPYELCREQSEDIVKRYDEALYKLEISLRGDHGEVRRFPTFVSKLLHCGFPQGFPIRDQRSVKAMACLAKDNQLSLKRSSQNYLSRNYAGVVDFFLSLRRLLEKSEGNNVVARLEEFDYASQNIARRFKVRNTWLRVIDKWLWLRGRQKR